MPIPKLSVACAELDYLRQRAEALSEELRDVRRDMRAREERIISAMRAAGTLEMLSGRAVYYLEPGPDDTPELCVRDVPSVYDLDSAEADDAGPLSIVA